jgi:hypothetical protein
VRVTLLRFSASVIYQKAKREATVHEEKHTIGDSISTLEYTTENRSIIPDGPLPTRVKAPVYPSTDPPHLG